MHRLNLAELAALMRRNPGRWMLLDRASDYGALSPRASHWRNRPPRAFAGGGFEFRVRREKPGSGGILLEGRHAADKLT